MGLGWQTEAITKGRILFRYDPFIEKWQRKAADGGPLTGDYMSSNVPDELRKD
jgi:hypothetical protein